MKDKMKKYSILLLLLLTGCGYEVESKSIEDGIASININGNINEKDEMNKFCQENFDPEVSQTICVFTDKEGNTQKIEIDNFKYQLESEEIVDHTTNKFFSTNVYSKDLLEKYCNEQIDTNTWFTNCTFKLLDDSVIETKVTNNDLYKEVKYLGFESNQMKLFDNSGFEINTLNIGTPKQVLITNDYVYILTKLSETFSESTEYQVYSKIDQEIVGSIATNGAANISSSNGKVLISKSNEKEVCELQGINQVDCISTSDNSQVSSIIPTDAWYDGQSKIYVLTTDGDFQTGIQVYNEKGELQSEKDAIWFGTGFSRFYTINDDEPIIFTPNIQAPGTLIQASTSITINEALENETINPDILIDINANGGFNNVLELDNYALFTINGDVSSQQLDFNKEKSNLYTMVLDSSIDGDSKDVYSIQHPFYIDYTKNKFSNFYVLNNEDNFVYPLDADKVPSTITSETIVEI